MRQMKLGLSIANLGYHYAAWRHPDVPAAGNMQFAHFKHCVKLAEVGKFDLIFLADSSAVRDLDDRVQSAAIETVGRSEVNFLVGSISSQR